MLLSSPGFHGPYRLKRKTHCWWLLYRCWSTPWDDKINWSIDLNANLLISIAPPMSNTLWSIIFPFNSLISYIQLYVLSSWPNVRQMASKSLHKIFMTSLIIRKLQKGISIAITYFPMHSMTDEEPVLPLTDNWCYFTNVAWLKDRIIYSWYWIRVGITWTDTTN